MSSVGIASACFLSAAPVAGCLKPVRLGSISYSNGVRLNLTAAGRPGRRVGAPGLSVRASVFDDAKKTASDAQAEAGKAAGQAQSEAGKIGKDVEGKAAEVKGGVEAQSAETKEKVGGAVEDLKGKVEDAIDSQKS